MESATRWPARAPQASYEASAPACHTKYPWGAFHNTDLAEHLHELGVTQVVVCGLSTAIGVESTARQAHEHGLHVTLPVDAMTDLDAATHDNSIALIFPGSARREPPPRSSPTSAPDPV